MVKVVLATSLTQARSYSMAQHTLINYYAPGSRRSIHVQVKSEERLTELGRAFVPMETSATRYGNKPPIPTLQKCKKHPGKSSSR